MLPYVSPTWSQVFLKKLKATAQLKVTANNTQGHHGLTQSGTPRGWRQEDTAAGCPEGPQGCCVLLCPATKARHPPSLNFPT